MCSSDLLLDRIDLQVEVTPISEIDLIKKDALTTKHRSSIQERIIAARDQQLERWKGHKGIQCNGQASGAALQAACELEESSKNLLQNAFKKLSLSARAYEKVLKIARTIADLDQKEKIHSVHLAEALQYRSLDKPSI